MVEFYSTYHDSMVFMGFMNKHNGGPQLALRPSARGDVGESQASKVWSETENVQHISAPTNTKMKLSLFIYMYTHIYIYVYTMCIHNVHLCPIKPFLSLDSIVP